MVKEYDQKSIETFNKLMHAFTVHKRLGNMLYEASSMYSDTQQRLRDLQNSVGKITYGSRVYIPSDELLYRAFDSDAGLDNELTLSKVEENTKLTIEDSIGKLDNFRDLVIKELGLLDTLIAKFNGVLKEEDQE